MQSHLLRNTGFGSAAIGMLSIAGTILFSAGTAEAFPGVCALVGRPAPQGVSAAAFEGYQQKLVAECEMSEKYKQLKRMANKRYGISLEKISLYQGMRFLERYQFDKSLSQNLPMPLTYQIAYADYEKPVAERSDIIWRNWLAGNQQFSLVKSKIEQGIRFGWEDLLRVHKNFYQLSDEACPRAEGEKKCGHNNAPNPGHVKQDSTRGRDGHWWKFSNYEEAMKAKRSVEVFNEYYQTMGFLSFIDEGTVAPVLEVKPLADSPEVYGIYSTDSADTRGHLENLLNFMDQMLAQGRQGQHMVWEGRLMSPGEVAMTLQQFFIQVHAFAEGNGRVSRFLQEMVFSLYEMPHGASGDLMDDDVLMPAPEYYKKAIDSTREHLLDVEQCLAHNYPEVLKGGPESQLKFMDQSYVPYQCRILD